jgi:hypothetical protein
MSEQIAHPVPRGPAWYLLRAALVKACHANTSAAPPEAWLDAATTVLTSPAPDIDPHVHQQPDEMLACLDDNLAEVRRLRAATSTASAAAADRRAELASLRLVVRQRAIDTLEDNPRLEETLHAALADWDLPPVPSDFTVHLTVPITVLVTATDEDEARREAASLLRRIAGLGYGLSADLDAADYTAVTTE